MHVVTTTDAGQFLAAAREFLLSDPVSNSVLLSVATASAEAPTVPSSAEQFSSEPPATWAVIREGSHEGSGDSGAVLGAAMRTPPRGIMLSRLPAGGAALLTEALLPSCADAPTVGGLAPDIEEFAELWAARVGARVELAMAQRLHQLERVFSVAEASGVVRGAHPGDTELLVEWTIRFEREAAGPHALDQRQEDVRPAVERRIAQGLAYVWDDDGPVSYVGTRPRLGGVVRVGPVYTPAEHRNRGYASALTAAVSRQALADGAQACALYTDLSNPTSNQIYAAIGYRPVSDAVVYRVHAR